MFRLEQRFTRDATEKDLTIAMTVTNLGRTTRNRVQLGRYFGMSPNHQNNSPNNASATSDSVFLWDDRNQSFVDPSGLVYGVMLTALMYNILHTPVVEDHRRLESPGRRRTAAREELLADQFRGAED